MNKKILKLTAIGLLSLAFTGCATTTLQTQSKMTRSITLDHSEVTNKNIYVQVTNTSGGGGENMQLHQAIKIKLQNRGYTVVDSSKDASYGLIVNVLFANNLKEALALSAATGLGTVAGVGSYAGGNSGRDALGAGLVMAIGAGIVGKALEDEIFRAIIDVNVRQYDNTNIRTIKSTSVGDPIITTTQKDELGGGALNSDGYSEVSSGISQNTTQDLTKHYEEHITRVFVEAVKMDLELADALPILEDKASTQITNIF